ncbi:hypothetical protein S7711_02826 [Stachybotrys chartarum IBT 7711]|uniref:Uncharacterized protein n=1 Tax=Stachybotrys chartarum (strain CBS 109288 / IBT 7711) TaxID=1280523 RepID=A0A084AH43_STACB|nr:hypothetical protein S7711_02826 [Stachybotrys chartarum IBT 7711]
MELHQHRHAARKLGCPSKITSPNSFAPIQSAPVELQIKMASIDDAHISVRFKYGIHTIYLFVDTLQPFSDITAELLELLRERYPTGLNASVDSPEKTPIPDDAKLAYGVLNVPTDPTRGWKKLNVGEDEVFTPTKAGLKHNSIVAFNFVEDEEEEVLFEVEWPRDEEDS